MSETLGTPDKLKGFDDFAFSLGDELRGERATLGKSLLDVQRDLRIKAAYIAAIENCDPSVFPNQGFIAGYVRSYGRYLKLDPDKMFERFCLESGFEGVNAGMVPAKKSGNKEVPAPLKGAEVSPRFASYGTSQSESILNVISPSGIASAAVLTLLIGGLSFGGWTLLNDIQRVEFAPVDQTPSASVDVQAIEATGPEGSASFDVAVDVPTNSFNEETDSVLGRLPDTVGVLKPKALPKIIQTVSEVARSIETALPTEPVVVVEAAQPTIQLYAVRAAWVRVHFEDSTVLFEKILEKGEYYSLPADVENPLLRAGNSGSVYVLVDGVPFGPVGAGTSVAKQVSLNDLDIQQRFAAVDDLELVQEVDSTLSTAGSQ